MNLGFDLDKIFIDYPPFIPEFIIDRLYKKKSNGTLLYRIPSQPEQLFRLFTHLPFFRPPIKENLKFLISLAKNKQHKHYLISSRFSFLEKTTNQLIKRHNFDKLFDSTHFNFSNKQPHIFKNETIKKLNIHAFIDDDLPLLKFLSKNNPQTIFFWLNKNSNKILSKNLHATTNIAKIITVNKK